MLQESFDFKAITASVLANQQETVAFDINSPTKFPHQLRHYQLTMLASVIKCYTNNLQSVLLQSYTGTGKTVMAGRLAELVVNAGGKFLFIIDAITLARQTYSAFTELFGLHCSIIQADNPLYDPTAPVQIATVQTLDRRLGSDDAKHSDIQEFKADVIAIDECHLTYAAHLKIREHHKCFAVGLTATPMTKGIGLLYDDYIPSAVTIRELIAEGSLSNFKAFTHDIADLTGIKTGGAGTDGVRDFMESDAAKRYTKKVIGDVVEIYQKQGIDGMTLLFASSVSKAKDFADRFNKAGITAEYIHAEDPDKEQKIADFKANKFKVLCNVRILVKGFDYPEILQVFDCAPTKSVMQYLQKFGRLLRVSEGKLFGTYHDCAGNIIRCGGTPDEIPVPALDYSFDREPPENQEPEEADKSRVCGCGHYNVLGADYCAECGDLIDKSRKCGACGHIKANGGFSRCENCGSVPGDNPKKKAIKDDAEEIEDGDLVEYTSTGENKKPKGKRQNLSEYLRNLGPHDQQVVYAQMCEYSLTKYNKTGNAFHAYSKLYGKNPPINIRDRESLNTAWRRLGATPHISDIVQQHFANEGRRFAFGKRRAG